MGGGGCRGLPPPAPRETLRQTRRSTVPAATTAPTDKTPSARRGSRAKPPAESPAPPRVDISPEARRAMIAEAAYLRAEQRGFVPGCETDDWLLAEAEVDALLEAEHDGSHQ